MEDSLDDKIVKDALLAAHQKEHESAEKFDYFICGMAGAFDLTPESWT